VGYAKASQTLVHSLSDAELAPPLVTSNPYGCFQRRSRTIKPDGSAVELKKSDVYDKVIEKKGSEKTKALTFALPLSSRASSSNTTERRPS
jgi:hypothetical protein